MSTMFENKILEENMTKIVTDRCVLRKVREDDAEAMFNNWANDKEVTKFLTWPTHENIEVSRQIINRWLEEEKDPKTVRFVITLKDVDEAIGSIDIVNYDKEGNPEIGYCLSRKYWNQGLMSEICKEFVNHLFDLGFKKVLIRADENNIGSNRVIEKNGFKFVKKERLEHQSAFKPEPAILNCYEIAK